MHGFFRDADKIVYILEYAPGGEVYGELMNQPHQRFDEKRYKDNLIIKIIYLLSIIYLERPHTFSS
jgi:hypothetical protein